LLPSLVQEHHHSMRSGDTKGSKRHDRPSQPEPPETTEPRTTQQPRGYRAAKQVPTVDRGGRSEPGYGRLSSEPRDSGGLSPSRQAPLVTGNPGAARLETSNKTVRDTDYQAGGRPDGAQDVPRSDGRTGSARGTKYYDPHAEGVRPAEADAHLEEVLKEAHELHNVLREPEPSELPSDVGYERLLVDYRTRALRTAGKTLDTANRALEARLRRRHSKNTPSSGQLREAIQVLGERSWWDELLADQGLSRNEQAQAAAAAIAERIARMDATDVHTDDLKRLRRDVLSLRQQITFAERHAEHLPTGTFRLYMNAAESITWEAIAGASAASASSAISGGDARTAVITAAVGAGVGAILGQLRSGVSRWHEQHTITSQLDSTHRELRQTIENLAFCLPALSSHNPQVRASIRSIALAAEGLANHAGQLASALEPLANSRYRNNLGTVRDLISLARDPDGQDSQNLSHIAKELANANAALSSYTDFIKQQQPQVGRD
jgi:hypothetical protein